MQIWYLVKFELKNAIYCIKVKRTWFTSRMQAIVEILALLLQEYVQIVTVRTSSAK